MLEGLKTLAALVALVLALVVGEVAAPISSLVGLTTFF